MLASRSKAVGKAGSSPACVRRRHLDEADARKVLWTQACLLAPEQTTVLLNGWKGVRAAVQDSGSLC